jgi:hypothetical protein
MAWIVLIGALIGAVAWADHGAPNRERYVVHHQVWLPPRPTPPRRHWARSIGVAVLLVLGTLAWFAMVH